ncbi:hypothetical protein FYK19_09100 [Escherichia albertii]|nr:hypothetical protein FYK19_09100 [Escherichia albertii]
MVEPDGVGTTGLIDTGASCDAPARPTIEMQPSARHKKSANAPCVVDEVSQGFQSRRLILQAQGKDTAMDKQWQELTTKKE